MPALLFVVGVLGSGFRTRPGSFDVGPDMEEEWLEALSSNNVWMNGVWSEKV